MQINWLFKQCSIVTPSITTLLILVFNLNIACAEQSIVTKARLQTKKINIEITSHLGDTQSFVKGDVIKFLISLDIDAYITVIYQTVNQQFMQLLPNNKQKQTRYKSGLFIAVPSDDAAYRFTIAAPYGKEKVWVFASDKAIKPLPGKVLTNGIRQVAIDIKTIKNIVLKNSKNYFGVASFTLSTSAR